MSRIFSPTLRWSMLGLLFTCSVYLINPVLPLFLRFDLGATQAEVGQIMALLFLVSILVKLPLGMMIGGTRAMTLAMVATVGMTMFPLLYLASPNLLSASLVRLLHGVFFSMAATTSLAALPYVSGKEKAVEAVAHYSTALAAGLMIGPGLGAVIVALTSVKDNLLLSTVIMLPPAIAVSLTFAPQARRLFHTRTERMTISGIRQLIGESRVYTAFLTYFSFSFTYAVLVAYGPLMAREVYGMPDYAASALFLGYFGVSVITRSRLEWMMREVGSKRLQILGLGTAVVASLLLGAGGHPLVFSVDFVAMGFTHGLIFPLTALSLMQVASPSQRVLANSILFSSFDLGQLLGPVFASTVVSLSALNVAFLAVSPAPFIGLYMVTRRLKA